MIKHLRIAVVLLFLVHFVQFKANAQNCTINAGSDRTICPTDLFQLSGTATGLFANQSTWSQVSGPAVTISATTVTGGVANATVTGYLPGKVYTFRLSAKCTDGTPIQDDAIYSTSDLTVANAGPDQVSCPGTVTMAANAVKSGETGTWSRVSGNLALPSAAQQHNPTAAITLPTSTNVGTTVFRWTITSSSGSCVTTDDVSIKNLGGAPVAVTPNVINLGCYTVTTSTSLGGSYGGDPNEPLQRGTWSFVSGPSTPVFSNIHANNATVSNLIGGTYILRWTVAGQCVNGSADVTIHVDAPSQSVTGAGNANLLYCDSRTSTTLVGVKPQFTNESVQWTASGGNFAGAVIQNANAPTTAITGLVAGHTYNFTYTITNTATGCSSSGNYQIGYTVGPSISLGISTPQILACGIAQLDIPYTAAGGTGTSWALVSGPAGSTIETQHGYNNFTGASGVMQTIVGLNKVGTYVIRFRQATDNASGGCSDAFADISIVISKAPYQANAGTAQLLACNVVTATLAGNLPQPTDSGVGQWTEISGPTTAVIADKASATTGISNLTTGVYVFRWIVSGGFLDCGDTQSDVKIVVSSPPTVVHAGTDIATCFGTPVHLNGNVPATNETGTWTLVSQTPVAPASTITFANLHDPTTTATGFVAGKTYVLRWSINNSCSTITDDVNVVTNGTTGPKQATATTTNACLAAGVTSFPITGNTATGTETGAWSLLPGAPNTPAFSTTSASQTVTGAIPGTYKFVWTLSTGACAVPSTDTVAVTISAATTTAAITGAPSQNVCGIGTVALTANAPAATELGTWTQTAGPGGATFSDIHSRTPTVSGIIEGRYTFTWTITNNACSSSSASITYTFTAPPTTAAAGPDQNLCNVTSATLAANAITTGTGLWSIVSGPTTPVFSNVSSPTSTVSGLTLGTYILKWTSTNGPICTPSSDNITITIGQSANAGADQNLCNTTTTVLVGNEGSTGTWTITANPTGTAVVSTNSNNTAIASGLQAGNTYKFNYHITAGGCGTLDDEVQVIISGPPTTADAGADQSICTANATQVTLAGNTPTIGTGAWSIISSPSGSSAHISNTAIINPNVTNLTVPGAYLLQWRITNNNCAGTQSSNDIVRITVYAPPTTAGAMAAQPTACVSNVTLTGTTPTVGVGTWTMQSGPSTAVFTSPNSSTTTVTGLVVDAAHPYTFRWTIKNGVCTDSFADVVVTVVDNTPTVASVTTAAPSVCTNGAGGTATLALTGNTATVGTGTWTVGSQPAGSGAVTFTGADLHSPNATAGNLKAGTYVLNWTIANAATACSTVATVTITVFDPPSTAAAGPDNSFCLFSPVTLAATAPTTGTGTWTTFAKPAGADEPVFATATDPHTTVGGLGLGNYTFRWTTSNGPCTVSTDDVVITIQDCQIAVAKEAPSTPVPQGGGFYNVTFIFHVKNTGTAAVNNIQVQDDLTTTFVAPKTYSKVSLVSTGGLATSSTFTGDTDKNLLDPASSTLAAGATATITLVVKVKLN